MAENVMVRVKRELNIKHQRRYPGEVVWLRVDEAEHIDREQPGAIAWNKPAKAPLASEAAAKLAAEHGIDMALLEGTGKNGLIVKGDVERYLAALAEPEPEPEPEPEEEAGLNPPMDAD